MGLGLIRKIANSVYACKLERDRRELDRRIRNCSAQIIENQKIIESNSIKRSKKEAEGIIQYCKKQIAIDSPKLEQVTEQIRSLKK